MNYRATFTGFTALMYAVLMDNTVLVKLLLEHGANPSQENEKGMRARDYANNNPQIMALLQEYEEKVGGKQI